MPPTGVIHVTPPMSMIRLPLHVIMVSGPSYLEPPPPPTGVTAEPVAPTTVMLASVDKTGRKKAPTMVLAPSAAPLPAPLPPSEGRYNTAGTSPPSGAGPATTGIPHGLAGVASFESPLIKACHLGVGTMHNSVVAAGVVAVLMTMIRSTV